MSRIGIFGATGRMGLSVVRAAAELDGVEVAAAVGRREVPDVGVLAGVGANGVSVGTELSALAEVDAIVDFSLATVSERLFEFAREAKRPLVTGTTGMDEAAEASLRRLSEVVPVVAAPNFSQGVTLLFHLAGIAASRLPGFDAEIFELHHRRKVDSPSGTAVRLGEVVREAKELAPDAYRHGREGAVGPRQDGELGMLALRGGDIVGEHTLFLCGEGERMEITHRAGDRGIFAQGALRAAGWVSDQGPGLYGMADVMGLG